MMFIGLFTVIIFVFINCITIATSFGEIPKDVQLPQGVKAVWNLSKANRESTSTREKICLNGLWRWQPARDNVDQVPNGEWGYYKVPGPWPGINSYIQKDCQTLYPHPSWDKERLGNVKAAWYEREIEIPDTWSGRRIFIYTEYLNSYSEVYLDGIKIGEIRFPYGEVDITKNCEPGKKYTLSLYVVAMPLKEVMLSYSDTNTPRQVTGNVLRRGLCGDVYLIATPSGENIKDVKVDTAVRGWNITFDVALSNLEANKGYILKAQINDNGKPKEEFKSEPFTLSNLEKGRFAFTCPWKPEKLWDIHTPQNKYSLNISLMDKENVILDTFTPVNFGFREFWIDGRDFYLNGTRIFCFAIPYDNPLLGAAWASYDGAVESLKRLKTFGVNLVYTHNYGCEPGSHLSFEEALKAADDVGMLVSFSQPHFSHYVWIAPDADDNNGYAHHSEFFVRVAQNHPSVVMYSMSHNSLGYEEDQNPDLIDGVYAPTEPWAERNRNLAKRAESIVKSFDSSRVVYHHSSGNFGTMHTINCYLNFVPIQERSDWFEHWSKEGIKPLFLCEYGDPWGINWTTYRGWYKNERAFGSARVPWEFCMAEWNSQFLGDKCYQLSELEKRNLRFESQQWRAGKIWYRWDYPSDPVSFRSQDRETVWAMHISQTWRAFRTWEVSSFNSWSYANFWNLRDGVDKSRENLPVDWENLQRPGFSPDYIEGRYERFDLSYQVDDWIPGPAAEALIRNNQPLLAYIGGKPAKFTSMDHNFYPGDILEKTVIIINNSRENTSCNCSWKLEFPQALEGSVKANIQTGHQIRIPIKFHIPDSLEPGKYNLSMLAKFDSGEVQEDNFTINILSRPQKLNTKMKMALFDPKGETREMLQDLGVEFKDVDANSDLTGFNILIIGKEALTIDGPGLNISSLRDGLRVIMFQQKSEVLEKRFGFRTQEYGLRQVFKRVPDHPILKGLNNENLRDWCGEATIVPPRLAYTMRPRYGPTIKWCDIEVTRAWRCGNYGNVATVLIEKPTCGNFLPLVDGGFNLQYSPLMEYREGKGMMILCQMDIIGRTEKEPAALSILNNMLDYLAVWQPSSSKKVIYSGETSGRDHLEQTGIVIDEYKGGALSHDQILVVGPEGTKDLSLSSDVIQKWLEEGGNMLAIGLDEEEIGKLISIGVTTKKGEHICALFEPAAMNSPLTGIGPADVTIREPREIPLVASGAELIGNGVLAVTKESKIVFCQLIPWQFDYKSYYNLKKSFLRTSFLVSRILGNMGVNFSTPLISRFANPVGTGDDDKDARWLRGFYLDSPVEMDDPYRYFRW